MLIIKTLTNGDRMAYLTVLYWARGEALDPNRREVLQDLITKLETASRVEFHVNEG